MKCRRIAVIHGIHDMKCRTEIHFGIHDPLAMKCRWVAINFGIHAH